MKLEEIRKILQEDPGNSAFTTLAEELRRSGDLNDALQVCLAGLSANPSEHKGRLLLARIYCEQKHIPFALRELETLKKELPENKPLKRLIEKLSPYSAQPAESVGPESTYAEAEFGFDELDLLNDEDNKE